MQLLAHSFNRLLRSF